MQDLGTQGYNSQAFSINNNGEIVGYSDNSFMKVRAVMWKTNSPPTANAGPDQTVSAGSTCTANVTLDGTRSSDPDADSLTYSWTGPFGNASGPTPQVYLPLGVNPITLTVSDGKGGTSTDSMVVTVQDITPPVINSVAANPNVLASTNHKMVSVLITVSATDNCDTTTVCKIVSVTSNEPTGGTSPDWLVTGNLTLNLRAERLGTGNGRVYTISVECSDTYGNKSAGNVSVSVPH